MKTYHLSALFFAGLKRRLFLFGVPLLILAAGAGVMIYFANPNNQPFNAAPFVLIFIAAILVFSIWNAWRQQSKLWRSYQLNVGASAITREQMGLSPITIQRDEIVKIIELPEQGLSICTTDHSQRIDVPITLEGYAELRACLNEWRPLETPPHKMRLPGWLVPAGGVGSIAAFLVIFLSPSKYLVIVVGLLMLILLIPGTFMVWRSKLVDRGTKRRLWMVIFPVAAIAARVVLFASEP
jgi:peptidoglycan/LPS O-acetylase OafA/YrhL